MSTPGISGALMPEQQRELDYLLSPVAIRERAGRLFVAAEAGQTHFAIHPERVGPVVDFVIEVIRQNYPDLKIPFHSRWGHFRVGGLDRVARLNERLKAAFPGEGSGARDERARAKLDLVVASVLLDAGAGEAWRYREPSSGQSFGRSEGLAVASLDLFLAGAFSHDAAQPLQVTAAGLENLTRERLEQGFQVTADNPLIGVEGRLKLLRSLGAALRGNPEIFRDARPGNLLDAVRRAGGGFAAAVGGLVASAPGVPATTLLRLVLDGLGPIWPGRVQLYGVNLGDCWRHPLLGALDSTTSLMPFHKLSQWLTYSLIEPIEEAGVPITHVQDMTGLPEYRNGGLLLDRGVLSLRNPADAETGHRPDSELIVEWRALTVVLLDRIGAEVRTKLGFSNVDFPLAKVLEGGTWWAGRIAAKELRADGSPPLKLDSDGTVF